MPYIDINIPQNIFYLAAKGDFLRIARSNEFVTKVRSSHQRCFMKKGVLRNFAKFTGKHLCQSLLFNKVAGLRKRLWHSCFPVNFTKFLRTLFFTEHLWTTASKKLRSYWNACKFKVLKETKLIIILKNYLILADPQGFQRFLSYENLPNMLSAISK